ALYRKVLARYVQMTTAEGITQAIFPEGGLSLDGRIGAAKLGLLSYIVADHQPGGRDVVFVPVGIAYDRVLEDRILLQAASEGTRRFRARPLTILWGTLSVLGRIAVRRFKGYGTAAAAFGAPVSLTAFMAGERATTAALGQHLMAAIGQVVPVIPVPLVAAALLSHPPDIAALVARSRVLAEDLEQRGAVLKLVPEGMEATVREALAALTSRGIVGDDLRVKVGAQPLLDFYAASILQRLDGPFLPKPAAVGEIAAIS
ncbi:MAG: glycerol-3-phosphate acyltransferase, partial [bacterium]